MRPRNHRGQCRAALAVLLGACRIGQAVTDEPPAFVLPARPRSPLYFATDRPDPQVTRAGLAGSGGAGRQSEEAGGQSGNAILIFPPGDLYPPYIADPHRVGFGMAWLDFAKSDIATSGLKRVALKAGARIGLVRVHPRKRPEGGWQFSLEGGYNAQFDAEYSLDAIGWDGNYGALITGCPAPGLAVKLGMLHDSAHVGDEYAERTGRRRLGYTRHEFVAAVSRVLAEHGRMYAEGGWGYRLSNAELMDPGRAQIGLEFEIPRCFSNGRFGWYAAVDLSAMEEQDWRLDTSLQIGLVVHSHSRTWRVGLERCDGRPTLGEFFQDDETYTAVGLWWDL